jgi:hypothetical protein
MNAVKIDVKEAKNINKGGLRVDLGVENIG